MSTRKTYKKGKTYKKRKTYKKIHGGMFPRVAKGLALDTIQAKIERSEPYSKTQKKLEETVNNGYNQLQELNKENVNNINLERFSPEKSPNPLYVPKRVFQTKNPPYNQISTTKLNNNFPQPNFDM